MIPNTGWVQSKQLLTYSQPWLLHFVSASNLQNKPQTGSTQSRPKEPHSKNISDERKPQNQPKGLYTKAINEQADEVQRQSYLSWNIGC